MRSRTSLSKFGEGRHHPPARNPSHRHDAVRRLAPVALLLWLSILGPTTDVSADLSCGGSNQIFFNDITFASSNPGLCLGLFYCDRPKVRSQVSYRLADPFCDPSSTDPMFPGCTVEAVVEYELPGNRLNSTSTLANIHWFNTSPAPPCDPRDIIFNPQGCPGLITLCGVSGGPLIRQDAVETFITIPGIKCSNLDQSALVYSTRAWSCAGSLECQKSETIGGIALGGPTMAAALCPQPPPLQGWSCGENACNAACFGPGGGSGGRGGSGGSSAAGGGPGLTPEGDGPGATLRYLAGGAGNTDLPRPAGWTTALGRYWSHDYAEAIVEDPDPSHVVLLTRFASFREFTDADADGAYETAVPSDEYRQLTKTAAGWELLDLDGTVQRFDTAGRWNQTVDKNGSATTASYTTGHLTGVSFPDQRSESFGYHPGGKLATITEVGVDGTTMRTWSFLWSGDDLERIDRPDGTAWQMLYADPAHPGFMTRLILVATDASERIEGAWEYDAQGNVERTWRGAATFDDPQAVEKWSFLFDDPSLPVQTTVTDPLGNVSVYTFGRDPGSTKPRVEQVSGDCPTCSLGPNSQLTYGDTVNPLRRTVEVDGRGTMTLYTWDSHGQLTSRVEALGSALERETTWGHDPSFPAFVTEVVRPSTTGNPLDERRTVFGFDGTGNQTTRTEEGFESDAVFSFVTTTTYTAEGLPEFVDPPGYGTSDRTGFTYDPARGGLMMATRTDPLIGTTVFGHDAFNRRDSVTDPNGVVTETLYDALDRVRFVIQRGAVPTDDLVTENVYNVFGDLFQVILPEGNVLEYGYDHAGRLTSLERKPDADPLSHGERTVWEPDGFGHRVRESQQRWDGVGWVTESETAFEYTNRCQLDKTITGAGSLTESVTEYAYDCDGNLERTWDANHPSAGQTAPASTVYGYDELDRLDTVTQPWGGAGGGNVVTIYGYDVQDHLTRVTDAEGAVTSYVYSDRDLLTRESSEVSGVSDFTYNEHGELETETDARGVVVTRIVDELDRVRFVDYPDAALDVTYVYDDPAVAFSLGRLTSIVRDGEAVDYAYDRFGRLTQDGGLSYGYDKNGNRTEVGYPGDVRAITTYDNADRPASLTVEGLAGALTEPLVTSASYKPAGPATGLDLGNGLSESRGFDARYHPEAITVTGGATLLDWRYTTDGVGDIDAIADALDAANDRSYVYQDFQYFLTDGAGPWGALGWTYDGIGNRLTETRDAQPADTYGYLPNAAMGNSAQLDQILLGAGGTRQFVYDAAGNQTRVTSGAEVVDFGYDDASRLASIARPSATTALRYDGRSFLRSSIGEGTNLSGAGIFCDGFESGDTSAWSPGSGPGACAEQLTTRPVYSSEGVLHMLDRASSFRSALADRYVFYFGSRPVATMALVGSSATFRYLSVDHLGTPVLATDEAGAVVWEGGFEPFGVDYNGAEASGVFLRFPGQWADETWTISLSTDSLYYNVYRWHQPESGLFTRSDPIGEITPGREAIVMTNHLYAYALSNPSFFIDPLGLKVVIENPQTRESYENLKKCFPLFRNIAGHFENDTWTEYGPARTWTIKDPDFDPPSCGVGGRRTETRTIWVPPGRDCKGKMKCLFHEFYELWLIRVGGYEASQMGAGPADRRARALEKTIPIQRCCQCP